jgi:hypothetical protein
MLSMMVSATSSYLQAPVPVYVFRRLLQAHMTSDQYAPAKVPFLREARFTDQMESAAPRILPRVCASC